MSTLISEVMEQILEETGIANTEHEREARRIMERNRRQRKLDDIRFNRLPYDDVS